MWRASSRTYSPRVHTVLDTNAIMGGATTFTMLSTTAKFRDSPDTPLYFPGKIVVDAKGSRLLIADSTHHRIVITDLEGKKIAIADVVAALCTPADLRDWVPVLREGGRADLDAATVSARRDRFLADALTRMSSRPSPRSPVI